MRLSCSTACYHDLGLEEALERIQAADFRYVELTAVPGWCHFNVRTADRVKLRRLLAKHNLSPSSLHAGALSTGEAQSRSAGYGKAAAEVAAYLGSAVVTVTAPGAGEATTRDFLATLQELTAGLAETGVRVAIRNAAGTLLARPEDFRAVFAHPSLGNIGMALDTGQFHSCGADPHQALRQFPDRVFHVYCSDRIGEHPVPLGHGEVDFEALVDALGEIGYAGSLCVQVEGMDPSTTDRYAKEALELLGRLTGEA